MTIASVFVSHGSPMLALEKEATSEFLSNMAAKFSHPTAIIVASAHWETAIPMLTGAKQLETIYDFYGFPEALYALRYTPSGNPALAKRIKQMLEGAGFQAGIDASRGLDHGAWNPLLLSYPAATIPVVQISVQPAQDARWHYRIGQALAPLREENILIIGSGNLTHNLYEAFRGHHSQTPLWVSAFTDWVAERIKEEDIESLLDWQRLAPYAKENHPTTEHFLPLFIALGAAGVPLHSERLHEDTVMGVLAMDAYAFGAN